MTSQAKIAANRRNAQRSTGPRTASGKARVRRNALRHGLAALALVDPAVTAEAHALAVGIGKDIGGANDREAKIIADCEVALKRVRAARVAIMETMAPGPPSPKRDARTSAPVADRARVQEGLRQLMLLDRYERRTISQRNRAVRSASLVRQDGGEGTV